MKLNLTRIGKGKPEIAIVGCLHGDEIIGKKVIEELRKITLQRGSLKLIIANEKALRAKKRMIQKDLNRSFPGNKYGTYEEKLAYAISGAIKNCDLVIDIHATTSNFDRVAIVTNLKKSTVNLLRLVPCPKVLLLKKKVFGGGEMIRLAKTGIAFEYGPDKKGNDYKKALQEILTILKNLDLLRGIKKDYLKKELYMVNGSYKVALDFKANKNIKNFQLIKKGQLLGKSNGRKIKSTRTFSPIFIGEKSYQGILAITATKQPLKLA